MIRHVRLLLRSAVILVTLQISAHAQPAFVTDVTNSKNFKTIGNLMYFTSGNSLWRTDGTTEGAMLLKSGFVTVPNSFRQLNEMLIFTTSARALWRSDGNSVRSNSTAYNELYTFFSKARQIYSSSLSGMPATGQELYRTDGTPGGTFLIKYISLKMWR